MVFEETPMTYEDMWKQDTADLAKAAANSIQGMKETAERDMRDAVEKAAEERDLAPSGWVWSESDQNIELTPPQLKKVLYKIHKKGAQGQVIDAGVLRIANPDGSYRAATLRDINEYPYPRPEIPQEELDVSQATLEEPQFKFPSVNDMTDAAAKLYLKGWATSNPYMLGYLNETDPDKKEELWKIYNAYERASSRNIDELLRDYKENEQPAALNWIGENVDLFDLATIPVGLGAAAKLGKYGVTAPVKVLSKMGPKSRLAAETVMQGGLEGLHSGIEGENVAGGAATGAASNLALGGAGRVFGFGGKVLKRLADGPVPKSTKVPDSEIFEQAMGLMDKDASKTLRGRISEEIAYPTIKDEPLLSPADIEAEINRRIPENLPRGLQGIVASDLPPVPGPNQVRLGDPKLTGAPLEGLRSTYPTEMNVFNVPESGLKESWITDNLRGSIEELYSELAPRTAREELTTLKPGKEGLSDVEKRILDKLPDVEYITLPDLIKALNNFKPKNRTEAILKNRLLNGLGTTNVRVKPGTKYELESVTKSAPVIPDWEKTIEPRSGWGWSNWFNSRYNVPVKWLERDVVREGLPEAAGFGVGALQGLYNTGKARATKEAGDVMSGATGGLFGLNPSGGKESSDKKSSGSKKR